jgi:hypothetical protein
LLFFAYFNLLIENTYFNNEENANIDNFNNCNNNYPVLININYSKKGNKKNKNRGYDIRELVNGPEANQTADSMKQLDLTYQNNLENCNNKNGQSSIIKPIKDLIAFKFEDNFISSDEEKLNKKGAHKTNNKNTNNNSINNFNNNKTVGNLKSNNNKNFKNNFFQKEPQKDFEAFQNSNSGKNLNQEQVIANYISNQKKNSDQYQSVFDENMLKEALEHTQNTNLFTQGNLETPDSELDIYYFEELLVEYYIKVISEFFPSLTSTEIMEKICEFDFDIDGLVISLLDTNHEMKPGELNKLVDNEVSEDFCADLFKNFYFEENTDYEVLKEHNLQLQIEQEIKKNNQVKINNKNLNLIDLNANKNTNNYYNLNGKLDDGKFLSLSI